MAAQQKQTQAVAPATNKKDTLALFEDAKGKLTARLPKGIDKDRFFLGIMTAIQKNPALLECQPNAVLLAAYDAAEAGCNLSPALALGWLIPYKPDVVFQPSYRFFIQRAYETGDVKTFLSEVVYDGDQFDRQYAPKKNLFHAPGNKERVKANAIGAYALIEFKDGTIDWEYLTAEQIDRHRNCSKQKNSMKWVDFWEEGWRITPIRVLAKRLPLRSRDFEELVEVINKDNDRDIAIPVDREILVPRRQADPEPPQQAQPETAGAPAEASAAPTAAEAPAAATTEKNGHDKPKKNGGGSSGLFNSSEAEEKASTTEIQSFWTASYKSNWSREAILQFLKKDFNVNDPKELTKAQMKSALDAIQQAH